MVTWKCSARTMFPCTSTQSWLWSSTDTGTCGLRCTGPDPPVLSPLLRWSFSFNVRTPTREIARRLVHKKKSHSNNNEENHAGHYSWPGSICFFSCKGLRFFQFFVVETRNWCVLIRFLCKIEPIILDPPNFCKKTPHQRRTLSFWAWLFIYFSCARCLFICFLSRLRTDVFLLGFRAKNVPAEYSWLLISVRKRLPNEENYHFGPGSFSFCARCLFIHFLGW